MEILEKIFGSLSKVKIMKLFIFNPSVYFDGKIISKKTKVRAEQVKKDITLLEKMGLIKKREVKNESGRKVNGWTLNVSFVHLDPLREFLLRVSPFTDEEVVKRLSRSGRLKLVVISGVFIDNWEARVDILAVGDRLKKNLLEKTLREIESELGKEIRYSVLDSGDFTYRLGVGDKLIRDIFDYPHKIIFNKIGLVE